MSRESRSSGATNNEHRSSLAAIAAEDTPCVGAPMAADRAAESGITRRGERSGSQKNIAEERSFAHARMIHGDVRRGRLEAA